jgi:hypothetical protein
MGMTYGVFRQTPEEGRRLAIEARHLEKEIPRRFIPRQYKP